MKIELLNTMPIILTKDRECLTDAANHKLSPGLIMILPEDAVLVIAPEEVE